MMGIVYGLIMVVVGAIISWIVYIGTRPAVSIPKPEAKASSRGKTTVVNGVKCKEDDEYYYINTNETEICPFCKSTKIFSGSWAPECCENCGATHMLGAWLKEKGKKGIWINKSKLKGD